ncbi:hypothetical protein ADL02_45200 [Streptomyces sp. NRRL WC-3723]|nr:hypothetical protein ADL02_45200 [Streptomyces sp. NRRL WC-3723]
MVLARSPQRALRHMPDQPPAAPGTGGEPVPPPPPLQAAPAAVRPPVRTEDARHDRSSEGDAA